MYQILIVDSTETLLEVLSFAFEKYQMRVYTSRSIKEIEQLLLNQTFDLIIYELNFEEKDGISFAAFLRKELKKDTLLFLMSEIDKQEIKLRAKENGVDGWILKPFIAEQLAKNVRKYLKYSLK